jgi:hypothetical protein
MEVVINETAAPDDDVDVAVVIVEEDNELWDEVGWEEELDSLDEDDNACNKEAARDDELGTVDEDDDNVCDEAVA